VPKINIVVRHQIGVQEAERRIRAFIALHREALPSQIDELSVVWNGSTGAFNLRVAGTKIDGEFSIQSNDLYLYGNLPLLFYPLKTKIESTIREYASEILK
jgi:Putative polyhydroxyalkanoic acid system protein (PHA_gran_rgn)